MSEATAPDQPPAPPDVDEPLTHDGPTFVNNGIIRFPMGDQTIRVRRPFLGELRALRLALQEVQDRLVDESSRIGQIGLGYQAEAQDLRARLARNELTPEEHAEQMAVVNEKDRRTARELDDLREQAMLDWWRDCVFGPLALDPVPDQLAWPTWILDPGAQVGAMTTRVSLVNRCLAHWRTVPTGPG